MNSFAPAVIAALRERGQTVATAESLTGGLVCASLVDVEGASDVVRGGVVAYAADLKCSLLGIDADHIDREGTVDPEVAEAMAEGVRKLTGATWGVATTGVAGPGPAEGKEAGTVYVAVAGADGLESRRLALAGNRSDIREQAVSECLSLLLARVEEQSGEGES